MRRWAIAVLILAACWILGAVGCHGLKLDGDCVYVRKVETMYTCKPDGAIEHQRVHPIPTD